MRARIAILLRGTTSYTFGHQRCFPGSTLTAMRLFLAVLAALLAAVLLINTAHAQRVYHQGELDAMLAPIALQPDGVVSQVLIASTYPDQVAAAARWARANAHLRGDDAVRAMHYEQCDPSVKVLVVMPD